MGEGAKTTGSAPVKRTISLSARRKIAAAAADAVGDDTGGEEGGVEPNSSEMLRPAVVYYSDT
jgi:hypothetical protein